MGSINLGGLSGARENLRTQRTSAQCPEVYKTIEESRTTTDNLISSTLTVRLHLQSSHFGSGLMPGMGGPSGAGGALLLRCTATIGKLYEQYTEMELGVPQRDPIPARGEY
ncbi:AGAP004369-PA-like protein [Anopheles sinensis]|uniref:AGAP004369-PA-like protein n=1 Tax=Anopheles sinensis TaxID=74873 RepID=A0A084VJK0_ANOSI|nr:AGAP004369-PA-like protein [Anopheles sinensis]